MKKIVSLTSLTDIVTELPRGGYLVDTSAGYIQFGSPPETVKDTMLLPKSAPQIFILPFEHFDPGMGISMAEVEFPTYFNFFIKKRKVIAYAYAEQCESLRVVFNEAFLGPDEVSVKDEVESIEGAIIPDIKKEMQYFSSSLKSEDLLEIRPVDLNGIIIGDVKVVPEKDKSFTVYDGGKKIAHIPARMKPNVEFDLGTTLSEPFIPPDFGITCLGPSHGFDPTQNTSGFILWINKTGIMVDPPVNSTAWLKDSNVNPKLIDAVILTHCHADHDAGTFQKILEESRVKVYTTPTVMRSFLKKYSALTRIPVPRLMSMFDFMPVKMNAQYNIHGAVFTFYYSVHSIPTIGFYFLYRDKTFMYSSDHRGDPEGLEKLFQAGAMSKERRDFFLTTPWEMDIIYHESGIAPLHTPVAYLNSLPEELQKKITVYHIAEKDFPKTTKLTLAKFGIGDTVYPEITKHRFEEPYRILDVFSRIDIFESLPFENIKYLLFCVKEEHFNRGDCIIRKDTPGDKFYVIVSGNVSIGGLKNVSDKVYGTYEYFGEASLVLGALRAADVIAATSVTAYSIEKQPFLRLIQGTRVEDLIRRIAKMRTGDTWNVVKANKYFSKLSSSQITTIEGILTPYEAKPGEILTAAGTHAAFVYILIDGSVEKRVNGADETIAAKGELIGDIPMMTENNPARFTVTAITFSKLYRIAREDFIHFLNVNPGVLMEMLFNAKA
ncbi:MAG: cAMP/cGMP-dependent 3',5'-cyclic-AMP/GMP phosphodiesterase [Spirochaetes bacterium]|nr:cAMP/cGMP-dependent 3',5'-cyclic-AMP/GMP phosphodiesterase [Spirochaetota bacterium]